MDDTEVKESSKPVKNKRGRKKKNLSTPAINEIIDHMTNSFNENTKNDTKDQNIENDLLLSPNSKRNAFELMMDSRNKVIGRNSPGKEQKSEEEIDITEKKSTRISRKCFLESWADAKGAAKRKRIDEEVTKTINHKLEERAKKLKKMLNIPNNTEDDEEVVIKKRTTKSIESSDEESADNSKKNWRIKIKDTKEDVEIVPKAKRGRPRKSDNDKNKTLPTINGNTPTLSNDNPVESGRNLRPRRSKIIIPDSPDETITKKRVIDVDFEPKQTPSKLAPIFIPKPKIDPKTLEAKREFLLSGLPSSLKLEINNKKILDETEYDVFPKISHIQQKTDHNFWNLPQIILPLKQPDNTPISIANFNLLSNLNPIITENFKNSSKKIKNFRNIIRYIKSINPNYPVNKTFKILYEQSGNVTGKRRSKNLDVPKNDTPWTVKFTPRNSKEIYGNQVAITSLRSWLMNFSKKFINSDSDFEASDDSRDSFNRSRNTIILSGPCGCGKTTAVYAICQELDYNILEVNASSRRTGKRLLLEMQEATQSHQVKNNPLSNFIKIEEKQQQKTNKKCALLIEDIDIVFEQDDGFFAALNQISLTTKRPIILTTTDYQAITEQKFLMQYQVIRFLPLPVNILTPWLQILCVVEGIFVDSNSIQKLFQQNKGDLRKTLLELEFWAKSGGKFGEKSTITKKDIPENPDKDDNALPGTNQEETYDIHTDCEKFFNKSDDLWWDLPITKESDSSQNQNELAALSKFYNCLTYCDNFYNKNKNNMLSIWRPQFKNSLSLSEIMEDYEDLDFCEDLSLDLLSGFHDLYRKKFNINWTENWKIADENRWRRKAKSCCENFQKAVPATSDRKSLILDYLPSLRNMARSEQVRALNNTKRGNRFSNYVKNLGVNCNESTYKFACDIFKTNL